MATISCLANGLNKTLTATSMSGNCWMRFTGVLFKVAGSASYDFVFTPHGSGVRFDQDNPIDWGPNGRPSWLDVVGVTAEELRLQDNAQQAGLRVFTVNNVGQGEPIELTISNTGGTGGAGGEVKCYLGESNTGLVGPLPVGVLPAGRRAAFGFFEQGPQVIELVPDGSAIQEITWPNEKPDYVTVTQSDGKFTISDDNEVTDRQRAEFFIVTSAGVIDPTIINNPDESGP